MLKYALMVAGDPFITGRKQRGGGGGVGGGGRRVSLLI